jgi:hypothetical protein
MQRSLSAGLAGVSCLVLMAAPVFARAMMIAPPPLGQRAAVADVIVVGKVTGFGDKLVSAVPPGGGDKVEYQIAVVQVGDPILGLKDVKEIKVAFIPQPPAPTPAPGPGPRPFIKRRPEFTLALEQEACLFLVKHPTEDFYVGQAYYDVINKKDNADFDKNLDEVKRAVKLLADPMAGLKSKSNDERFQTAALLVARYRTPRPGQTKTEPIDSEESKQILLALADADWNPKPMPGPAGFQTNPQAIFFRLNLQPQDGWTQPKDPKDIPDAARQWLKDNAGKYRLEHFVADKKGDK